MQDDYDVHAYKRQWVRLGKEMLFFGLLKANDCDNVRTLAIALNMDASLLLELDGAPTCCGSTGMSRVYCLDGQTVNFIDWSGMIPSLTGYLNESALLNLQGLIGLNVGYNNIYGSVPALPNTLEYLYVNNNQFTGELPSFPSGLIDIFAQNN